MRVFKNSPIYGILLKHDMVSTILIIVSDKSDNNIKLFSWFHSLLVILLQKYMIFF